MARFLLTVCFAFAFTPMLPAQPGGNAPTAGRQVEQRFTTSDGASVPYLLYLPESYAPQQEGLPLLLFLHGRGESNGPLSLVAKWGPPRMVARGDSLPYILVSPQCPSEDRWESQTQQKRLVELLDHIQATYRADAQRIYLSGLSMGGTGSWHLAALHPSRFAAAVIICGSGDSSDANRLKDLPIWVFHGDQDEAVPLAKSVTMVEAIRKAGGDRIRLTTLEHVGHNSWSAAYATPEVFDWLSAHVRPIEE